MILDTCGSCGLHLDLGIDYRILIHLSKSLDHYGCHHAIDLCNQLSSVIMVKQRSTLGLIIYWLWNLTWLFVWLVILSKALLLKFHSRKTLLVHIQSWFKGQDSSWLHEFNLEVPIWRKNSLNVKIHKIIFHYKDI